MLRANNGTFIKDNPKPKNAYSFEDGKRHPGWKGDSVGYYALHAWIKRAFGKADHCDNPDCVYPRKNKAYHIINQPKRFEWANLSGLYKRDRFDYVQLCPSCHRKMDKKLIVLKSFVIDGATYVLKETK